MEFLILLFVMLLIFDWLKNVISGGNKSTKPPLEEFSENVAFNRKQQVWKSYIVEVNVASYKEKLLIAHCMKMAKTLIRLENQPDVKKIFDETMVGFASEKGQEAEKKLQEVFPLNLVDVASEQSRPDWVITEIKKIELQHSEYLMEIRAQLDRESSLKKLFQTEMERCGGIKIFQRIQPLTSPSVLGNTASLGILRILKEETERNVDPEPILEEFNETSPPPLTEAEYNEYTSFSRTSLNKQNAIEKIVLERNISYLIHFTRADNLPSIMKYGIRPVADLNKEGISHHNNDQERWDGRLEGTSVSLTSPNSKMFFKYRSNISNADWVVLIICRSVLWKKDCAFFKHNAADKRVRKIPKSKLTSPSALEDMFQEGLQDKNAKLLSRDEQKLDISEPTDEQAEVLVFDTITPKEIVGIVFENNRVKSQYETMTGNSTLVVESNKTGMFSSRNYMKDKNISRSQFVRDETVSGATDQNRIPF